MDDQQYHIPSDEGVLRGNEGYSSRLCPFDPKHGVMEIARQEADESYHGMFRYWWWGQLYCPVCGAYVTIEVEQLVPAGKED